MIPIQRVFTEYQCFQNTNIRNIIKEILIFSFPLSVGIAVTVCLSTFWEKGILPAAVHGSKTVKILQS